MRALTWSAYPSMPLEAATSLIRQSVVPACWFSATIGLPAPVGAPGWVPAPAGGAASVWRSAAPTYPAPMRTARHATAATRPLRTRAGAVILPAASAAIPDHRGTSLPGVHQAQSRRGGGGRLGPGALEHEIGAEGDEEATHQAPDHDVPGHPPAG